MSSQNVFLHSKAIRLTVARLDIMLLARRAGPLLVTADLVVNSPGQACAGQLALLAWYTQLTGYVLVAGAAFPWLAAVGLLPTVLLFRYGLRGGVRKYIEKRFAIGSIEQRGLYLRGLAIDVRVAKEIRILGLVGWFRDYWRTSYLEWLRPLPAARRIARLTAITVLVPHRFSTVRMADLIVVLRDGRAKGFGDHDTLIKNGGIYAELCILQAKTTAAHGGA